MPDETAHNITLKLDHGYEFLASFDRLPEVPAIRLDEPAPLGSDHGPNAVALLASAVGNCLSASLLFCLRKSRVEVTALQAHVTARVTRTDTGRLRVAGIDVRIDPTFAATADPWRMARCMALFEDFCVVTESVRHGVAVTVTVEGQSAAVATGA